MSKHTPGPWTYQEESDVYTHIVRGPNNHFLVQLSQDPTGTSEANARLMAAAPDLLEALEMMLEFPKAGPSISYASAAIAKATQP